MGELVADGEPATDEVLDSAVDAAVLTSLLALQEARAASDPGTAAELCLGAVPHIVLAVTLASTAAAIGCPSSAGSPWGR
ncbi:hypothetical protein GCM10027168_70720 [Streptomyces capparidis]